MNQRMLDNLLIQFNELEHDIDELNNLPAEAYELLLKEIVAFKSLKPWQWMDETQLFNVFITDLNKEFICTILGHHDDLVGFVMYEGEESYHHYCNEKNQGSLQHPVLKLKEQLRQPRYQITFEDKMLLSDEDHQILDVNQRRFRGAKQWPKIRYIGKGCQARMLNELIEIEIVTACLMQTTMVAKQVKNNRLNIPSQSKGRLTYVTAYKDQLVMNKDSYLKVIEPTVKRLSRIQKHKILPYTRFEQQDCCVVLSQLYVPSFIKTNRSQRHPFITVIHCDEPTYNQVYLVNQEDEIDIWDILLKFIETVKARPKYMLVDDLVLFYTLTQGCQLLEIEIKQQEDLDKKELYCLEAEENTLKELYETLLKELTTEQEYAFIKSDFIDVKSLNAIGMNHKTESSNVLTEVHE